METPQKKKSGPKPKQLTTATITITGLPVGRDNKVVPPTEVEKLAQLGCRDRDIANFFGIAEDTLRRNFAHQLARGREQIKINLRRAMLDNAIRNNNAAVQIFLAKNILGMSDNGMVSEDNEPLPWRDDDTA